MKKPHVLLPVCLALAGGAIALSMFTPDSTPPKVAAVSSTAASHSHFALADAAESTAATAAPAQGRQWESSPSRTRALPAISRPEPQPSTGGSAARHAEGQGRPPEGSVFAPPPMLRRPSKGSAASVRPPPPGSGLSANGTFHFAESEADAFEVEPGVAIPATLAEVSPEVGMSAEQAALHRQIAEQFVQAVESNPDVSAAWQSEQVRADARFRLIFGDDLQRWQSLKAAREARGLAGP